MEKRILCTYSVNVMYDKDYFDNPNHPLNHTFEYMSVGHRTKEQIQEVYKHAKVLSINLTEEVCTDK